MQGNNLKIKKLDEKKMSIPTEYQKIFEDCLNKFNQTLSKENEILLISFKNYLITKLNEFVNRLRYSKGRVDKNCRINNKFRL